MSQRTIKIDLFGEYKVHYCGYDYYGESFESIAKAICDCYGIQCEED